MADEAQRHVQWDEMTIAEHDKERGTRMKIDEPPTPYHAPAALSNDLPFFNLDAPSATDATPSAAPASSSSSPSRVVLQAPPPFRKAAAVAPPAPVTSQPSHSLHDGDDGDDGDDDDDDDDDTLDHAESPEQVLARMEEERHRAQFEAARKKHYDEAIKLKQLKQLHTTDDDDDDDDA